jgi:hypothetical protein
MTPQTADIDQTTFPNMFDYQPNLSDNKPRYWQHSISLSDPRHLRSQPRKESAKDTPSKALIIVFSVNRAASGTNLVRRTVGL